MPNYRRKKKVTFRKSSRKVVTRTTRTRRVALKRPAYKRKYKSNRTVRRGRRTMQADVTGARLLAAQTTNPSLKSMYRNSIQIGSNLSSVTVRGRSAVADVYNCKFVYAQNAVVGDPSAPLALRGNSIIDPGLTTDNQDCAYVPELSNLYRYFRVTSSKMQLHMQNAIATTPVTVVLFCTIIPVAQWTAALPLTLDGWVTTSVPHRVHNLTTNNTDHQIGTMEMFMNTSALFNSDTSVEDFSGTMPIGTITNGVPPAEAFSWYWGVAFYNYDGSVSTAGAMRFNVRCTFYTTLDAPLVSSEYQPGPLGVRSLPDQTANTGTPASFCLQPSRDILPRDTDMDESVYVKLPRSSLKR